MNNQRFGVAGWLFALAFLALAPIRPANAQCEPVGEVPGVNGPVSAMLNWDPDGAGPLPPVLVVGGTFSVAGTVVTENIATWNPATGQWSSLGSGLNSDFVYLSNGGVNALAVMPNGDLVAGGRFEYTGVGADAYCVKRWNGVAWSDLGSGFSNTQGVFALAVLPNGDLVAGGTFGGTGSIDVFNIARWNGSAWSDLNGGTNNHAVYALAVMPNGDLVAGGDFGFIGNPQVGVNADHIARWDGATWHEMGGGVLGGLDGTAVHSLKVLPNGELIVGGEFLVAGGQSINYIARWDGSVWSPLGTGTSYIVNALAVMPNGDVVAGGYFTGAGGFSVNYVARWNGSTWSPLGSGMNYPVLALAGLPDGDLMAGGIFNIAGGVNVQGIARWNGTVWSALTSAITASDAAAGDEFGISVAVSGDAAVVGSRLDDNTSGVDTGSAYVYVKSGTPGNEVWTQQAKLIGDTTFGEAGSQSGISVALSGNTALVGSWLWPSGNATGAAYVFVRSGPPGGEVWTQQAALVNPQFGSFQYFGYAVALEGDTAVIGTLDAPGGYGGAAFFYARSGPPGGEFWTSQQIHPSDGVPGDQFGNSVAISSSQDTAIVGAWREDNAGGADTGSAYIFNRAGSQNSWVEYAKLTASDGAAGDLFGVKLAIDGDTVVVGAYQDDHAGGANAGSAYVFTRSGTVWTQQAKLTASDAAAGDAFGVSLALSGNTVVVGAHGHDGVAGSNAGSAYVFTRSGTVWTEQFKLTAPDPAAEDWFGVAVALSGNTAVIGARQDDHAGGVNAGSVHIFDFGCESGPCCAGDFDASHVVDSADVTGLVAALLAGGGCPVAPACCSGDLNGDGFINGSDVRAFVAKLLAGGACP